MNNKELLLSLMQELKLVQPRGLQGKSLRLLRFYQIKKCSYEHFFELFTYLATTLQNNNVHMNIHKN